MQTGRLGGTMLKKKIYFSNQTVCKALISIYIAIEIYRLS